LRQAGLPTADVKIIILRNQFPNEYHAVAATRVNGEWLILDNRQLTLVRDTDMIRATPKFLLDEYGVHRFVRSHDVLLSSLRNVTGERTGAHTNFGSALGELRVRNKRTLNGEHIRRYAGDTLGAAFRRSARLCTDETASDLREPR
jgi:hypothetical protein